MSCELPLYNPSICRLHKEKQSGGARSQEHLNPTPTPPLPQIHASSNLIVRCRRERILLVFGPVECCRMPEPRVVGSSCAANRQPGQMQAGQSAKSQQVARPAADSPHKSQLSTMGKPREHVGLIQTWAAGGVLTHPEVGAGSYHNTFCSSCCADAGATWRRPYIFHPPHNLQVAGTTLISACVRSELKNLYFTSKLPSYICCDLPALKMLQCSLTLDSPWHDIMHSTRRFQDTSTSTLHENSNHNT